MPAPTPMPAFAPVERPVGSESSPQGKLSAKTWLMMTDIAAVVLVAEILAATAELMDASTVCGTDIVVETTV
jgi:hypothetical protein